jgi:CubicO group peptidase (beta-lactamase class C family)
MNTHHTLTLFLLFFIGLQPCLGESPAGGSPGAFSAAKLTPVDAVIEAAIGRGEVPGAVLVVGNAEGVFYRKAYGNRAVKPEVIPMTVDTVFDMASLTKPTATATSVMLLIQRHKLKINNRIGDFIPYFAQNGKGNITVEQLLLHRGGLTPDNSLDDYVGTRKDMIDRINALPTRYEVGKTYKYTDVGFIVLGELVQAIDGRTVDVFAKQEIFEPLGMHDTTFKPTGELAARCAPTEFIDGEWRLAEVHDPRAYRLGGVAGHAGLFSTADDLARYCRMLLNKGELDGVRILEEETVREMTKPRPLDGDDDGWRTYGFSTHTSERSTRGKYFDYDTSFGHTGWTGTAYWIDPTNNLFYVLLTSRCHPNGSDGDAGPIRREVATCIGEILINGHTAE